MLWTLAVLAAAALHPSDARAQSSATRPSEPEPPTAAHNPHGPLKDSCTSCHVASGWRPARVSPSFQHAPATFPLGGAHARSACGSCHATLEFSRVATTCASCHQDIHRGELGKQCATCHSSRSFIDRSTMARNHQTGRFPLRGAHALAACETCHAPRAPGQLQFVNQPTTCIGCHAEAFRGAKAPDHVAASFSQECTSCHTIVAWSGAQYDHDLTRFRLDGAHAATSCAGCHADKVYRGKSMECASCHQGDYDRSANPPHRQGFPTACASCHTTAKWSGAKFDHDATTFPLVGGHRSATCADCHGDRVFKGKATACVACHQKSYDATVTPPHAAAGFSTTCATCHTSVSWRGATFDHGATKFPLVGAHRAQPCLACHADKVYVGKPTACASCHDRDYSASTNPHHAAAGFVTQCESCHDQVKWTGGRYDHSKGRFPLTGAHVPQPCTSCHADKVYAGKPAECVSCHKMQYDRSTAPNHAQLGFPATCATCHDTQRWLGAKFDHAATSFPLTGAHNATPCAQCHVNGVYRGTPTTCASCHDRDYSASTSPHHAAAGFVTTCQGCHTTTAWRPTPYDHSTTRFPLTGAHGGQTCLACHADKVYKGKPTACISCHQADWNGTKNPPHASSGFPQACESCHGNGAWTPSRFNHANTAFPLTGAHNATPCLQCHVGGVYKGTQTSCAACHTSDYSASTNPHHAAAGFATLCTNCHTTSAWKPTPYDHARTQFPLTGAHANQSCISCHADKLYAGKPTTCISCHSADWSATKNPPHAASGFSQLCATCHTTQTWIPSTFSHATTAFPLTGAHVATPCLQCHVNGVYKGTPATCESCHLTDYNGSTNPNHRTAMFPTTCATCHTTSQWTGATFNHDPWFPVYSGSHRSRWSTCTQCHQTPTNYKIFTCLTCHEHAQGSMDSKHVGKVSGYKYDSQSCYSCHPRGTH